MSEKIWLIIVYSAMALVLLPAIPFFYLLAARGWYWGSPQEIILLGFFVACLLAGAWVGALHRGNDDG